MGPRAAACLFLAAIACSHDRPAPTGDGPSVAVKQAAETAPTALDEGTCDSSRHESTALEQVYTFDLACALAWLASAGCDFGLDPNGDGTPLSSSTIEDLQNDPAECQSGAACTGCTDGDSLASATTCEELASTAYFTESAWADVQAACPSDSGITCSGGTWSSGSESVALDAEQACAVLEIANWATRGQLTEVTIYSGVVSPSAGLQALQATGIIGRSAATSYLRSYTTIDQILAQPDVGIDALADLRDFVPSWIASGRMGDSTLSAEGRLLAFVNSDGVTSEELDSITYIGSTQAAAILAGRPYADYDALVAAVGGTVHWVEPGGSVYDYAQEWYVSQTDASDLEGTGCTIEGVAFSHTEMTAVLNLFSTMSCTECAALFDSRICEDAIDDGATCQVGSACTGCGDGDGRGNGVDCEEIAAYSYFGPSAAVDLLAWAQAHPAEEATCTPACGERTCGDDGCGGSCGSCGTGATCDTSGQCTAEGCSIEGVVFTAEEQDCALWFFEHMDCDACRAVLDSRTCEDAIDDAASCQVGSTCTGCGDGDTRADGVDCDEISTYSYLGASAASALLAFVQADGSCGEPGLVVEGIPLETDQAAAILTVANGATEAQLDDEAGLDSRAAANIVAERPFADVQTLAEVSYVGATVLQALLAYAAVWVPEDGAPVATTVGTLADEAASYGTSSAYYDGLVSVARAVLTSEPTRYSSGAVAFFVADPSAGFVEELKVYVSTDAGASTSALSIFDEVSLTGRFTRYGSTWEVLLDDPAAHAIAVNISGLAYEDYLTVQGAWASTAANPEGSVRVVSDFGYTYMVPLPIFVGHPMWAGVEPDPPSSSGSEQDHNWIIEAQAALDAWRAT
ncbi:MAG: hypothetical protein ABIO70_22825 [Pseudomonadota bacterium]